MFRVGILTETLSQSYRKAISKLSQPYRKTVFRLGILIKVRSQSYLKAISKYSQSLLQVLRDKRLAQAKPRESLPTHIAKRPQG